jgi:hypothetical protein
MITKVVPTIWPGAIVSSSRIQEVIPLMTGTAKRSGATWVGSSR